MNDTCTRERPIETDAASLLDEWSDRTGVIVETWAMPDAELSPGAAQGLMAVLCAVEDGVRPRVVNVAITTGARGLRLTVSHDDPGRPWGAAHVRAVRATFAQLGGRVSVNSVPGGGTTLTGVVPSRDLS